MIREEGGSGCGVIGKFPNGMRGCGVVEFDIGECYRNHCLGLVDQQRRQISSGS